MRQILVVILLLGFSCAKGQLATSPWQLELGVGSYGASLAVPRFNPFHLRCELGATYQWNQHPHSQWVQGFMLGYFRHRFVQRGVQAYTEFGWRWQWDGGVSLTPLLVGGGYVLSSPDMASLEWNPATERYEQLNAPIRHNWLISIGSTMAYQIPKKLISFPISLYLSYRLHVQGIFIQRTVPIIVYSPLTLGIRTPLSRE